MTLRPLLRPLRRAGQAAAAAGRETLVRAAARTAPALPAPPREPRSIFVLRNNDVGDLLIVTPLFAALRRLFPGAEIAAGVGDWNRDVLRHNPHLSAVLPVNAPWFNKYQARHGTADRLAYLRSAEVQALAARRFEIGIDVLGSAWGALLLMRAGIPYRLGTSGFAGGSSALQAAVPYAPAMQVGRAALRFAELLGAGGPGAPLPECRPQIFLTAEERAAAEARWGAAEGGTRRWRIVVGPGGGLAAKRWPADSFAALVHRLPELGDVSVLVLGGPGEEELVAAVAGGAPAAWTLPPPGLREVFALTAAADAAVCNSSMLLHAAAAFARPTVAVLGAAFPSAREHQAQWGYPGLSHSLGKEPGARSALCTPGEALQVLRETSSAGRKG